MATGSVFAFEKVDISVHLLMLRWQHLFLFALCLCPTDTSSGHKQSHWLVSCLWAPRQRWCSFDPEPPTPVEFHGPNCCLTRKGPGYCLSCWGGATMFPPALSPSSLAVAVILILSCQPVWNHIGDYICASKYIQKKLMEGRTGPP